MYGVSRVPAGGGVRCRRPLSRDALLIEPEVLEAAAVVDAVDYRHQPLQLGLPAALSS
jgi:hypothetical protein